ncbi:hypothetical protein PYCC9005_002071 [Savitreella phatthalungensis]
MSSNNTNNSKTFVPESGLTTDKPDVLPQSAPQRTSQGITAPPAIVKEADKVTGELNALTSTIGQGDDGQHPIKKYHSFFYQLLTWQHPRASGVLLLATIGSILTSRFVDIPRLAFYSLWTGLLATVSLELVGRFVFRSKQGLVSQFAPKQLYTIPRASLDPIFDETHSLLNFIVGEVQRLLFVRNVRHSLVAFASSFVAYNLIKLLPLWGLLIIGTLLAFALPPLYLRHQQAIDAQLQKAAEISQQHYNNAYETASKQASELADKARTTVIDLGNKAGVDVRPYISGPGPVTSTSVQDELAKQPILTDAKPKADGVLTNKVPTTGASSASAAAPSTGSATKSPPTGEHVADKTAHDDNLPAVKAVKNEDSIAV